MQNWFDVKSLQTSAQGVADGIDKLSQAWEPWMKAVARGQLEAMSLASRRMQAYLELPARLGGCKSPQELAGEQIRFWQSAAEQYTDSCHRIVEAYQGLAPAAWSLLGAAARADGEERGDKRQRDFMSFGEHASIEKETEAGKDSRRAA